MVKTTLQIDGMMCGMCEAHICDTIRKAVPKAKTAIDETGYTCLSVESAPYEKKGLFGRK